ncbi:hypothetical protein MM809_33020, partial [Klebsiella pneumoniae]|nr:hypothetical protein [Klebsiella pneumoniae]
VLFELRQGNAVLVFVNPLYRSGSSGFAGAFVAACLCRCVKIFRFRVLCFPPPGGLFANRTRIYAFCPLS